MVYLLVFGCFVLWFVFWLVVADLLGVWFIAVWLVVAVVVLLFACLLILVRYLFAGVCVYAGLILGLL